MLPAGNGYCMKDIFRVPGLKIKRKRDKDGPLTTRKSFISAEMHFFFSQHIFGNV